MRKIVFIIILLFLKQQVSGQVLVSAVQIASKTSSQVNSVLGSSGGPYNPVKIFKITYNTIDPFNNPTIASGAVFIPTNNCDSFPVLAYCHGTVLRKNQVPSNQDGSNYEGLYFASKGYIVAMPDYLGLGDNPGFHPYLHSETEATATIDLIRAMREYIADSTSNLLDGTIFVTGYSQGGHAAMATLKHIKENNLQSEFNVVAGAPMSGPYSLSLVQPRTMYDSVYNYNAFSPYVINSYQYVYGNLYSNINAYYDAPFDLNIPPHLNGTSSFEDLNIILPVNIYDFMQDSVLDNFVADTFSFSHPLRQALKLNDNYSWNAAIPLRLCYCGNDDLVLPANSLMAQDSMTNMGSADVLAVDINPNYNHSTCFTPALSYVRTWFNTLRTDCNSSIGVAENYPQENDKVVVFPDPASTLVNISSDFNILQAEVIDINGKTILKNNLLNKNTYQFNIENLNNGFYIIKSIDGEGSMYFNKFMILKNSQ